MADRSPFPIFGHGLTLARVAEIIAGNANISLAPEAAERVAASRAVVERVQSSDRALYGINTGFGFLANQRIALTDTEKLQENLILSHAVGVGDEVPREIVHLMLLLKVNALAIGLSGVSLELIEYLIRFFNARVTPVIFTKGSLGASGDLAPLAHLTLALLGHEKVWLEDRRMTAHQALAHLGLAPLKLRSKEGLALINGTQFMLAYAVHCLFRIIDLLKTADLAATMTLEALRGSALVETPGLRLHGLCLVPNRFDSQRPDHPHRFSMHEPLHVFATDQRNVFSKATTILLD